VLNDESTDRELLDLIKQRNTDAMSIIIHRYESQLIGYFIANRMDASTAHDLTQETFLKLIKKPPKFLKFNSLKPWIYRVAANLLKDQLRVSGRFSTLEKDLENGVIAESRNVDISDVEYLLTTLPEQMRQVVTLRIYGDLTFQEISNQLDVPLGTVLWRMRKAIGDLRKNYLQVPE